MLNLTRNALAIVVLCLLSSNLVCGSVINGDADGPPGDGCFNCGFIGIYELNIVLGAWNQFVPPADPRADWSGDSYVGIDDLNWVLSRWNNGTPPAASTVPEPVSLALMGMAGLFMLRRP